jgi:ion channel-forming bestrophin family protein
MRTVIFFGLVVATFSALWATIVFLLYRWGELEFLRIPFLPIATVGTAVAFYVGFKNNASYERFWEGRKIWGGVVNSSRTWATAVLSYILPGDDSADAKELRRVLIYRQLAWINAVRLQLRKKSRFFHKPSPGTARRLKRDDAHMRNDWHTEISPFLSAEEFDELSARVNTATHIVTRQGTHLAKLHADDQLNLFHQIELMGILEELYTLQGKCERIKNTPFPRQYAEYSRVFTRVFVFLVPLGLLDVFADQFAQSATMVESLISAIPMVLAAGLITWVFGTMEAIGDASEDPFERSMNDVPMNALCVTIERDLREMLGETELPPSELPSGNILY